MKITIRQAVALYRAVDEMAGSGVKLSVLRSIDLAMNKKAVEALVLGYEQATAPADAKRQRQFADELKQAERRYGGTPAALADRVDMLMAQYKDVIEDADRIADERRKSFDAEYDVNLIKIPRGEFKCEDSDKAAGVLYGLLPCIE